MIRKIAVAAVAAITLLGATSHVFAADAAAGQAKSATCVACHGANGISVVPIYPKLAGQHAAYLEASLKAYRSQERKGGQAAIMWGMAAGLSDEDIADLSAYYASLSPTGN